MIKTSLYVLLWLISLQLYAQSIHPKSYVNTSTNLLNAFKQFADRLEGEHSSLNQFNWARELEDMAKHNFLLPYQDIEELFNFIYELDNESYFFVPGFDKPIRSRLDRFSCMGLPLVNYLVVKTRQNQLLQLRSERNIDSIDQFIKDIRSTIFLLPIFKPYYVLFRDEEKLDIYCKDASAFVSADPSNEKYYPREMWPSIEEAIEQLKLLNMQAQQLIKQIQFSNDVNSYVYNELNRILNHLHDHHILDEKQQSLLKALIFCSANQDTPLPVFYPEQLKEFGSSELVSHLEDPQNSFLGILNSLLEYLDTSSLLQCPSIEDLRPIIARILIGHIEEFGQWPQPFPVNIKKYLKLINQIAEVYQLDQNYALLPSRWKREYMQAQEILIEVQRKLDQQQAIQNIIYSDHLDKNAIQQHYISENYRDINQTINQIGAENFMLSVNDFEILAKNYSNPNYKGRPRSDLENSWARALHLYGRYDGYTLDFPDQYQKLNRWLTTLEREFLDDDDFRFSFSLPNGISHLSSNFEDYTPYMANQISFGDHWIMARESGKKAVIFSLQLPLHESPWIFVCDFSKAHDFDDLETLHCMVFENNLFSGYLKIDEDD